MQEFGSVECNAEGDEESSDLLKTLVDNRHNLVKAATRITGCPSRAEDVVQDAFFRLANGPAQGLPLKARASYVFRIVHNLAIDSYRKQALEQRYTTCEEEGTNAALDSCTPETESLNQETLDLVELALKQLPERTRYAFVMYRVHGKQQKDIAKELGVSPTLVNFMIRDALIHCRHCVKYEPAR
ncbi:RNA polymerase factor sigma-70 [Stutzerimonas kirkiae]|uniref:RNA polymerase factor sigma-70 n=1 Tax=Stutzerimonas kirkiae TaxID=2211392 RepID=A0A4Q9R968_9GAMM|nr:RNA polymerase factor sigma-70 [Stutzerimonas kirkiae]TBU96292.1 RNA polymerase factor sigma-70 [Stutzerimonas kirkiae]TBV03365.1 RNA polymerase factor sigma-70 [Stutzerimonas kirkiae]TBV04739.1 RNA polymerase factor sigma-70 [Stutzerimonas kirkiae]TBV12886.1 RNA polymerase factor sigma-70 [Stutzerimonas kirkiae]